MANELLASLAGAAGGAGRAMRGYMDTEATLENAENRKADRKTFEEKTALEMAALRRTGETAERDYAYTDAQRSALTNPENAALAATAQGRAELQRNVALEHGRGPDADKAESSIKALKDSDRERKVIETVMRFERSGGANIPEIEALLSDEGAYPNNKAVKVIKQGDSYGLEFTDKETGEKTTTKQMLPLEDFAAILASTASKESYASMMKERVKTNEAIRLENVKGQNRVKATQARVTINQRIGAGSSMQERLAYALIEQAKASGQTMSLQEALRIVKAKGPLDRTAIRAQAATIVAKDTLLDPAEREAAIDDLSYLIEHGGRPAPAAPAAGGRPAPAASGFTGNLDAFLTK